MINKLIIECSNKNIDLEKINSLINNIDDWNDFVEICFLNGILPLMFKVLKNTAVPQIVLEELKSENRHISLHNIAMSCELIRLNNIFNNLNLSFIPYKGPLLSALIFNDITQRQYQDLDILVKEKDLLTIAVNSYSRGISKYDVSTLYHTHNLKL
jgi:hypothetical protein